MTPDLSVAERDFFAEASMVLPGGVSSPARSFAAVGGVPPVPARGYGAYIVDRVGRRYVDYLQGWGSTILGHGHPAVVSAVSQAARRGTSIGLTGPWEVELARRIISGVHSIEMVRFVTSGTEAAMLALRLSRASTGRQLVMKFDGAYHGHVSDLLHSAGSAAAALDLTASAGTTAAAQATIRAPYNDVRAVRELFARHGGDLAAVIVEPVSANMGLIPALPEFLRALRDLCDAHSTVLVFDEVVTGFRLGAGGAQTMYGIAADLTCLGKVIGGGLPLAAVGGPASLMEQLTPSGPVFHAGTHAGNPVAAAAGAAVLDNLTDRAFEKLRAYAGALATGLRSVFDAAGIRASVTHCSTLVGIHFTAAPPRDFEAARAFDRLAFRTFYHRVLQDGILLPPSPFEALYPSVAHGDAEIEKTLVAAERAAAALTTRR